MSPVTPVSREPFWNRIGPLHLLALLLYMSTQGGAAGEWEKLHDEGGVAVWQRPYENSLLMEFRGECTLRASLGAVMALLRDADYNRQWVYRSGGARILQATGHKQAYVYGVVDAPWPIQDRDTVVRFDYRQDPASGVITIDISNHPDFIPEQRGLVRVPDFGGFWQLTPLPGGTVEVIYQVRGDPGGQVPDWLANYAAALSVRRTLSNMQQVVSRYSGTSLPALGEPAG